MSRATQSKSRADKKGDKSAPTPAVTHEIVPGKYTDVDWNRMLELDDGEDFIGEVVEEVVSGAISIIYDKYIQKQLLPYTVSQAKEALLTIIDWRFLACDPGEGDVSNDSTWQEDEEPTPSIPDCWAQGSVPKTFAPARPLSVASIKEDSSSLVNEPIAEETQQQEIDLDEQPQPWVVKDEDLLADEKTSVKDEEEEPKAIEPTPPSGAKNKRKKFRPHKGRLQSAGVSNMCESLTETERRLTTEQRVKGNLSEESFDQTASKFIAMPKSVGSILKHSADTQPGSTKSASPAGSVGNKNKQFQAGRPPGSRDVYYDEHGNVIAMSKINPDKLPTHRIKTKFHVVDPAVEAAQARLDAMRTGRFTASKPKKTQVPISEKAKLDKSSILDLRSLNSRGTAPRRNRQAAGQPVATTFDNSVTPLPPPMIESMELAPGVVVREGDRVKKGPRQLMRTADKLPRKDVLRPVGVEPDMTISVQELLGGKAPMVRLEPTPVPPIINKHMGNAQKMVS